VANTVMRIYPESEANKQLLWDMRQRIGGEKTYRVTLGNPPTRFKKLIKSNICA